MELKYIVMTIIKILISVPSILLVADLRAHAAALMGGHLDNTSNSTAYSNYNNSYEVFDNQELSNYNDTLFWDDPTSPGSFSYSRKKQSKSASVPDDNGNGGIEEEIPDPSPLVVPGYNLPENIFNKGKPFYLEKDPLTGKVDFDSGASLLNVNNDDFDYVEDDSSASIYDKSAIDRKDGTIASHKASDVNQLTPNFHDFLNLPVKYNPDKYVYPLISSSYANTKVQGNIHKYQNLNNHKNFVVTTYKPTISLNHRTHETPYYNPDEGYKTPSKTTINPTTTTTISTTTQPSTTTTTTKAPNLMNSGMNLPSFEDEGLEDDYYGYTPGKSKPNEIYLTTKNVNDVFLTTKNYPTTTRRTLSLFEQLFGEYDEVTTTQRPVKSPSLYQTFPTTMTNIKRFDEVTTSGSVNIRDENNILAGTGMGHESAYEYEDDYANVPSESTNYQTKPVKFEVKPTSTPSHNPSITTTTTTSTTTAAPTTTTTTTTTAPTTQVSSTTYRPTEYYSSTDYDLSMSGVNDYNFDDEDQRIYNSQPNKFIYSTTDATTPIKITSLPLGEHHFGINNAVHPIIAITHNIKEHLNNEKVITHQPALSTNSIRISPDQDSVSFVVGNHQNIGGSFFGTSFKEGPYDNSPFRPLVIQPSNDKDTVSYTVQAKPAFSQSFSETFNLQPQVPEAVGSSVNIQPIRTSEASLSIGVPINGVKKIPGQVVDEDLENENIEFPREGTGAKIVFPEEEKTTTFSSGLQPPLPENRDVLQLSSKPMYHQLPSDLTPPSEQDMPSSLLERPRPPWDPRPGHFYNGRPEYIRPPRPPQMHGKPSPSEIYKRIDSLPNILPQFRPTSQGSSVSHYFDYMGSMKNGYLRQPLLERPSNRPVGFFEKLVPPPPPKNLHNLRRVPMLEKDLRMRNGGSGGSIGGGGSGNVGGGGSIGGGENIGVGGSTGGTANVGGDESDDAKRHELFEFYSHQTPPSQPILSNRRKSDDLAVETLQMIQAKQIEKKDMSKSGQVPAFQPKLKEKEVSDKPLYVVYPVNSAPIKLDALDSGKKETVVVGTRAELPLPPSKISQEFNYESPQDRNDAPILKPHPKPSHFPIKSDFPYPMERPDISLHTPSFPEPQINNVDVKEDTSSRFSANNQWGAVQETESHVMTGSKINYKNPNQISVTLRTYSEKPIAVAYTPTEPYKRLDNTEKYSMPNYAGPVISEIRPSGTISKTGSEITVSAIMHAHSQMDFGSQNIKPKPNFDYDNRKFLENHKSDTEPAPAKLDFQAPFQASMNIDGMSRGWTVVRNSEKSKINRSDQDAESTTIPFATTREFDIEKFKPQLFGGFKPIYSYPDDDAPKSVEVDSGSRELEM